MGAEQRLRSDLALDTILDCSMAEGDLVGWGRGDSRLLFEGHMVHLLRAVSTGRRDKVPREQDQKRDSRTRHGLSAAEGKVGWMKADTPTSPGWWMRTDNPTASKSVIAQWQA